MPVGVRLARVIAVRVRVPVMLVFAPPAGFSPPSRLVRGLRREQTAKHFAFISSESRLGNETTSIRGEAAQTRVRLTYNAP